MMSLPVLIESTRRRFEPILSVMPLELAAAESLAKRLDLPMQHQDQTNWCWAAVTVTVFDFYRQGAGSPQCEVVNLELGLGLDCCNGDANCNQMGTLNRPLQRNKNLKTMSGNHLQLSAVTAEIDNGRPIGCRVLWNGGGSHFLIIHGYGSPPVDAPAFNTIDLEDPWFGPSTHNFDTFPAHYQQGGAWTHSYFTKP